MLELHLPLTKAPLFVDPVVEREQLLSISKPVRERRSETHIAVGLEACDVPLDTLGDSLCQLAFGLETRKFHLIVGREPPVYLLAMR